MPLDFEEKIFDIIGGEMRYIVDEFALGVFGIGALFFAYGSVTSQHLRILIALIGFSASSIMWIHMFSSSREVASAMNTLKEVNRLFYDNFLKLRAWRVQGRTRYTYYPVTRLMTYFMALVSLSWASIGLSRIGFPLSILLYADAFGVFLVAAFLIYRRWQDLTGRRPYR